MYFDLKGGLNCLIIKLKLFVSELITRMGAIQCFQKAPKQYKQTLLSYAELKATYRINSDPLGKGSFGTVYKCYNRQNEKQMMAIKAIDKKNLSKGQIAEIYNEVKLLQSVDH